jgi:hypothetical protein
MMRSDEFSGNNLDRRFARWKAKQHQSVLKKSRDLQSIRRPALEKSSLPAEQCASDDAEPNERKPKFSRITIIFSTLASLTVLLAGLFEAYQYGKKHEDKAIIEFTVENTPTSNELEKLFQKPFAYCNMVYIYNSGGQQADNVEFDIICDPSISQIIYYKNNLIDQNSVAIAGSRVKVSKVPRYKRIPVVLVGTVQSNVVGIREVKVEPSGIFKKDKPKDYLTPVMASLVTVVIILYFIVMFMVLKKRAPSNILEEM